jgi:hypothetical protein
MKSKTGAPAAHGSPIGESGRQQRVSAKDVGFDERHMTVDRAINVTFGREIHHNLWLVVFNNFLHLLPLTTSAHINAYRGSFDTGARDSR